MTDTNPMRKIRVEKVTLNVGAGKNQEKLEKAVKLVKSITGSPPVKTFTNKRIPAWGLRPGLPIGCKLTLRKEKAAEIIPRLLQASDGLLKPSQFDSKGNISFGIHEYIDIPDSKYDPDIGIMGLEVSITLERPGYRIKKRKLRKRKLRGHAITKNEAVQFMEKQFGVRVA